MTVADAGAAMPEDPEMLPYGEGQGAPLQPAERVPRGLFAEAEPARRGPVFVKQIAIRGFKSFRLKAKIGPLSFFSCIVGPNGAGKSVIGEALAFVLGGSAKTMRAKCLSALLNEDMRNSGTKLFAKVSVTLEGLESHQVKVSRVITGSTSSYIWSSDRKKGPLSFSDTRQELLNFGIAADISERFIIMQSRQAIKAKQPSDLCQYLEVIFGAGHFKGMITETEKEICEKSNETILLQERLTEVQSNLERLRPEVEKWQSFDSHWHDFQSRKVAYLHFQENALRCKLLQNSIKRDKKLTAYCKVKESKDAIQDLQKNATLETNDLKTLLQQKKRALGSLEKRFFDLRTRMVKAQVRLSAAKKDAENKGQEYLEIHQQQDALKKQETDLSVRLDELKDRRKALSQQKELLKGKKPKYCHQKLVLEIDPEECSNFVGEDWEDELFEKILKFQEALMAIEREVEGHKAQAFNLNAEVNSNLSHIYGSFTKHGDAYLSFTEEKTLLFIEGVNFQVRPGRHKWCSFGVLSGGQQALAALALSFSLQRQFPSPFYFFDEIDAALDTKNTQLVANYVKKQTCTQYIIVSHRPQLYEHASTIAGIYHCSGSSRSITAQV